MKHIFYALFAVVTLVALPASACAGFMDTLTQGIEKFRGTGSGLDDSTIVKGLKEALATGTARAVKSVSQRDGYFGNEAIKILVPEKLRTATSLLGRFGFQQQVDDLELRMNRAAEKAAPMATDYFVSALKQMTFEDARQILNGGNTAATEYFRSKTGDKIFAAFKPVVTSNMQDVGVANSYGLVLKKLQAVPFGSAAVESLDLDSYVTGKAVDGLFTMLGEEEKKIRTDPAARGTELLRKVFGK
ncbi:hypothetical protein GPEL0_01r0699 [Geoanaerobacter pelophilus]|uniref:DUF4197 domain-containing protein n=1 Tax=Geoanaerobacter pelophilus TaxID=60036 RepID=A0ABQ0MF36_9BACT|nr:DUF4197 domain-containing protein [Geoanaerobacter pelophilus]GAW65687.1 hypothetical protein GPEL0_01r0699 [Geoanaerobacter pelophilus]